MRFLIDNMLSIKLAAALERHGHEAVHVGQLGLGAAADDVVLEEARRQNRVLCPRIEILEPSLFTSMPVSLP